MKNLFNSVQMIKPSTNVFDLSYDLKMSLNMGDLVPVHCMEIVPGDRVSMGCESMLRFAPLVAPVMHKVDVTTHFFFVPNRLVWSGWESFITDDNSGIPPAAPYVESFNNEIGSLGDYLGIPIMPAPGFTVDKVSAIPFAAYQKIYNEYYRDQNLQTAVIDELADGSNNVNYNDLSQLRKRAWQHDYFTSALPWAQKGAPVTMPVAGFNDVAVAYVPNQAGYLTSVDGSMLNPAGGYNVEASVPGSTPSASINVNGTEVAYDPQQSLIAKTSLISAGTTTINDLRRAIKLQEYLEKDARGGTRYTESMLVHFGVHSSDKRLQRPEFLGGVKQPMVISEVLQTAEGATTPQGNMAGHGISVGSGKAFNFYAEEHGYIIGIMSVMPKTAYQQGIPRHFSKFDKFDYYWPEFANIGEQPILNRELYYSNDGLNNAVFGYTPRYSEYKYNDSRVAGDFRSSLSFWHLGRIFSSRPNLNSSFVQSDPSSRIFAVEDPAVDKIYAHVFHRIKASRKMPKYGTPSF